MRFSYTQPLCNPEVSEINNTTKVNAAFKIVKPSMEALLESSG